MISNLNPKLLYGSLSIGRRCHRSFVERIEKWRCGSGTFRMNVALAELPDFICLPGRDLAEHHTAGIIIAPSLKYMEQAYFDARTHGWSRKPIVEVVISSTLDDTLAPKGQHVASLFCQHVAPELPNGSWDDHREAVADLMIDTVDRYAPNFKRSVLGRQIMSPLDLERTFGLVGGDIFHGALDLGQMFSARPMLGHADYRGPVPGLYMCGSGTHPGGGVTGLPGHNAAREVLRDFKRSVPHPECEGSEPRRMAANSALAAILRAALLRTLLRMRSAVTHYPPHTALESAPSLSRDARGRSPARPNPGRSARCRGGSRVCA